MELQRKPIFTVSPNTAGDYCKHGVYWRETCGDCEDECDENHGHRMRWCGERKVCLLCGHIE